MWAQFCKEEIPRSFFLWWSLRCCLTCANNLLVEFANGPSSSLIYLGSCPWYSPLARVLHARSPRENVVSSSTQPNNRSGGSSSSTPTATVGNGPVNSTTYPPVKKEASSTTTPARGKENTTSVGDRWTSGIVLSCDWYLLIWWAFCRKAVKSDM